MFNSIQWIFLHHCGYWWPSALAPGYQWPQCWVCIHAFPAVYDLIIYEISCSNSRSSVPWWYNCLVLLLYLKLCWYFIRWTNLTNKHHHEPNQNWLFFLHVHENWFQHVISNCYSYLLRGCIFCEFCLTSLQFILIREWAEARKTI